MGITTTDAAIGIMVTTMRTTTTQMTTDIGTAVITATIVTMRSGTIDMMAAEVTATGTLTVGMTIIPDRAA